MAWSSPTAPAASSLITTSFWTAQITNNLLETAPAKFTTKGDGFFATGANAGARVPVAANGGMLFANSACTTGWQPDTFPTLAINPQVGACIRSAGGTYSNAFIIAGSNNIGNGLSLECRDSSACHAWAVFSSASGAGVGACKFVVYDDTGGVARLAIDKNGQVMLNTAASNANMTTGLTINQGAADNEILALKSSDVAHGMTTATETDTFGLTKKVDAANGGIWIQGYSAGTSTFKVTAAQTTENAARTTGAFAAVELIAVTKSGTTTANPAADTNIVAFKAGTNTRFIFDSDGDLHADAAVSASAFDAYDDMQLMRALQVSVPMGGIVPDVRDKFLKYNREHLQAAKLASYGADGSVFVNYTKLQWLTVGALMQMSSCIVALQERNAELTDCLLRLGSACHV